MSPLTSPKFNYISTILSEQYALWLLKEELKASIITHIK